MHEQETAILRTNETLVKSVKKKYKCVNYSTRMGVFGSLCTINKNKAVEWKKKTKIDFLPKENG